jgi:pimeloyl-ACP methyl ester carboxylesterase
MCVSTITLASYVEDFYALCQAKDIKKAILISHSMSSVIAKRFVIQHPELCSKPILMAPSESPRSEANSKSLRDPAATVRKLGIAPVVDAMVSISTSSKYKPHNLNMVMEIRSTLLGQDLVGYAKRYYASGTSFEKLPCGQIKVKTLLINAQDDRLTPTANCEGYQPEIFSQVGMFLRMRRRWRTMLGLSSGRI